MTRQLPGRDFRTSASPAAVAIICTALLAGIVCLAPTGHAESHPDAGVPGLCASSLGMTFVLIPGGDFEMGGASDDPRYAAVEPPHRVWVDDFWMQETEVTVDQFVVGYNEIARAQPARARLMLTEGPTPNPQLGALPDGAGWRAVVNVAAHGHAVTRVTWAGACLFADWLSRRDGVTYRLPTEAEWEKAAKGGEDLRYSWGSDFDPGKVLADVARPGRIAPNPLLLYDLTGNAWEWCLDLFEPDYYKTKPCRNPCGPAHTPSGRHSVRGVGGAGALDAPICYSTIYRVGQEASHDRQGFRLVREVSRPASGAPAPERGPEPAGPTPLPREDRR